MWKWIRARVRKWFWACVLAAPVGALFALFGWALAAALLGRDH
jgi:hypothetical protein